MRLLHVGTATVVMINQCAVVPLHFVRGSVLMCFVLGAWCCRYEKLHESFGRTKRGERGEGAGSRAAKGSSGARDHNSGSGGACGRGSGGTAGRPADFRAAPSNGLEVQRQRTALK